MKRRDLVARWAGRHGCSDPFRAWVEAWIVWQQMTGQWDSFLPAPDGWWRGE